MNDIALKRLYIQHTEPERHSINPIADFKNYSKFGLIFNYDLLGYGVMALSTFFTGLSMKPKNKTDKWLRALMLIHGVFYFSCTFMPMTGMFAKMSSGGDGIGGRLALVVWCVYFLPIGILSFIHFTKGEMRSKFSKKMKKPIDSHVPS